MKRFRLSFALLIVFYASLSIKAEPSDSMAISKMDSVEISLLTCSPHEEIYSLYGHTAIRIHDLRNGEDVAVNYGMFSFKKPYFVLRFVFGLTDYEMAIEPFEIFCRQYQHYGSSVTQQVLNLTNEDKWQIINAVNINYMPENSVYRYNYFYDNCTTRAIDMLVNHIQNAQVVYEGVQHDYPTFREMVHECTAHHPWTSFGNDMLLGVQADHRTSKREWQFLPENAMDDFDHALIVRNDGTRMPLVNRKETVVTAGTQIVEEDFPLRPRSVFLIVLSITVAITVMEMFSKKAMWGYDALMMVLCGLAGIILFLMLFSQHPTVRINFQLLLLNPLPLFFIWRMVKRVQKQQKDWQYAGWIILICLFIIGGIWQQYAEGMYLLASSLLIRNVLCMTRQRRFVTNKSQRD